MALYRNPQAEKVAEQKSLQGNDSPTKLDTGLETAVELNRRAWDSFRSSRDDGTTNIRKDMAAELLRGNTFLHPEVISLLGDVTGKKLLDLGCGDGAEMLQWAMLGAEVVGIDQSRKQLDAAKRNADKLGVQCKLIEADLHHLPQWLLKCEFEIVYSDFVVPFIGDFPGWLSQIYRALGSRTDFVLVGQHPLDMYFELKTVAPDQCSSYFSEGPVMLRHDMNDSWNGTEHVIQTVSWHRTTATLLSEISTSGFRILNVLELLSISGRFGSELPRELVVYSKKD